MTILSDISSGLPRRPDWFPPNPDYPGTCQGAHWWRRVDGPGIEWHLSCKFCNITLDQANKEASLSLNCVHDWAQFASDLQICTACKDTRKCDTIPRAPNQERAFRGALSPEDVGLTPDPPPSYRGLIEVPEGYHLWRDAPHQAVFLYIELDATDDLSGTWLRKHAFSDREWAVVTERREAQERGFDASQKIRAWVQLRVNNIVEDWRERFDTP